jgi:DNA mismatch endonuclease, patch repair protein
MADVLTAEQRSRCMAAIRGKNTKPERLVRSLLHAMGYRFRLHRANLPGRPDIVLPKHRVALFVHGCFWHVHSCRFGKVVPKTNAKFWADKRQGTVKRDRSNRRHLSQIGWKPVVIWECETRAPNKAVLKLRRWIGGP